MGGGSPRPRTTTTASGEARRPTGRTPAVAAADPSVPTTTLTRILSRARPVAPVAGLPDLRSHASLDQFRRNGRRGTRLDERAADRGGDREGHLAKPGE